MESLYNVSEKMARHQLEIALPVRSAHVKGVARRALSISSLFPGEEGEILVAAAILHDIGYSPKIALSGFHPLDGARYLKSNGIPDRICGLVAHHTCAYREAELRGLSAELSEWQDEETHLRDALWWADLTTTPHGKVTSVNDRIDEIQKRYGPRDLVTFFIRQAKSELIDAVARTEKRLKLAGMDYVIK